MKSCEEIYEITKSLRDIVIDQGRDIDIISEHVEDASVNIEKADKNIRKALKYSKKHQDIFTLFGFGVLGFIVGGPVGTLMGMKFASGSIIGTGIGGTAGYSLNKIKKILK
jgi:uncharacterized membrane protein YjjP (DUF1212 family)